MKRKRMLGLAVVALALAGLVSLLAYRLARTGGKAAAPQLQTVVAAANSLSAGARIQVADLKILRLPPAALPKHVYANAKLLVGRVLTTAAVPNQVIVSEMVAAPGSGVGLPPLIPAGMRAVSVKVNDVVSVAGYAVPGTHVDVLLTGNPRANNDPADVTTVTLLSNVQVLTAGEQMERSPDGKPERVTVITLLVSPQGAEKLAMADGYGHLQLALRNPLDDGAAKVSPLINGTLYREPVRPVTVRRVFRRAPYHPAPPPTWSVAVISGSHEQTVKFPAAAYRPRPITRVAGDPNKPNQP
jgi:pilus assembly protein CpaB